MPRKPHKNVHRKASEAWMIECLCYGFETRPGGLRSIRRCQGLLYGEPLPPAWEDVQDELLPEWIREHPGSRPFAWWAESSEVTEPRRQVGGGADPIYGYGAHGLPLPGHWSGDRENLPVFESQAAYLQRRGLLTATEKRWLANHPEALEPVTLKYNRIGMGLSNETEEI